jgi:hypothetical protein
MLRYRLYAPLAVGLLIGIVLQLILIVGDARKTPNDAVISFSKAYFMQNPSMVDWLCEERKMFGDIDLVAYHLTTIAHEAKERGYSRDYMKNRLYHIRTTLLRQDDETAEVRITGRRRFAMNPLYDLIGQLFGFTEARSVEAVLTVVKEDGRWKVCGSPFRFPTEI